VAFPVKDGTLGDSLPPRPPPALRGAAATRDERHRDRARALLEDVEPDLQRFLRDHGRKLTAELGAQLTLDGEQARKQEDERYRSRQGEVSSLIAENTLAKLEREVEKLKADRAQGRLFEVAERLDAIDRSIEEKQEEIARRTRHYQEVREQLDKERERILKHLLPKRHAMAGEAQVFPVCVEIRLPAALRSGS
jgi:vacuolar-type H+-ATPase subunit I/STV1